MDEQRLAALPLEVARTERLRDAPAGRPIERRDARGHPPARKAVRGERQREQIRAYLRRRARFDGDVHHYPLGGVGGLQGRYRIPRLAGCHFEGA
jgi:hypothetical protein